MQEQPNSQDLLEAVLNCLQDQLVPALEGRPAFDARVAARTTAIVKREMERGAAAEAAARERLEALLGRPGSYEALNEALCERIERGEIGLETPGFAEHLWASVLDQVAIDQPGYPSYRRLVGRQ